MYAARHTNSSLNDIQNTKTEYAFASHKPRPTSRYMHEFLSLSIYVIDQSSPAPAVVIMVCPPPSTHKSATQKNPDGRRDDSVQTAEAPGGQIIINQPNDPIMFHASYIQHRTWEYFVRKLSLHAAVVL